MEKLDFEQMETINGGVDCNAVNSKKTAALALGITVIGLFTGGIGAIILGPSAVGLAAAAYICIGK